MQAWDGRGGCELLAKTSQQICSWLLPVALKRSEAVVDHSGFARLVYACSCDSWHRLVMFENKIGHSCGSCRQNMPLRPPAPLWTAIMRTARPNPRCCQRKGRFKRWSIALFTGISMLGAKHSSSTGRLKERILTVVVSKSMSIALVVLQRLHLQRCPAPDRGRIGRDNYQQQQEQVWTAVILRIPTLQFGCRRCNNSRLSQRRAGRWILRRLMSR